MDSETTGGVIKDYRALEQFDIEMEDIASFVAEHLMIKTKVVVRIADGPDATSEYMIQRFFNGAIAAGRVKHSGVVQIHNAGFHDGRPYLIEEHLEGETLYRRLRDRSRLPIAEVVHLGRQIVSILLAMREAGVVHRDLKPRNIFLAQDAAFEHRERVKICSFYFAKNERLPDATNPDAGMCSPPYMPPEQWESTEATSTPADIYALGCIIFEMCCGQRPFLGTTVADYLEAQMNHVPPRLRDLRPDAPLALDRLVAVMLAKTPLDRPSLEELDQGLMACQAIP